MHYGNRATTRCQDAPPDKAPYCSDHNTTQFLERLIDAENPDLIVFTGLEQLIYIEISITSITRLKYWIFLSNNFNNSIINNNNGKK
jgi:hypothetical protein